MLDNESSERESAAVAVVNATTSVLSGAALTELTRARAEWTGLGIGWLRSLLGKREWSIDCLDLQIRL